MPCTARRLPSIVVLVLCLATSCDCGKRLGTTVPVPSDPLRAEGNVASLDGTWRMTTRVEEGHRWTTVAEQSVRVPGHAYPFNDKEPREVELIFERQVTVPPELTGRRVLIELDSVDYWATVEWIEPGGRARRLGEHEGYIGRFAVPLGASQRGTLRVRARDRWEAAADESYPRTTVQGMDPTGWGVNPMGILGSVRLRAVGSTHLLHGYAARLSSVELRIAAELDAAEPKAGELRYEVVDGGRVLVSGSFPLTVPAGRSEIVRDVAPSPPIDPSPTAEVRMAVVQDGAPSDQRTVPLVRPRPLRRIRGVGTYFTSRLALATGASLAQGRVEMDRTYHDTAQAPFDRLVRSARELGANWIRPAHHVPPAELFAAAREQGLSVYLDFPLHWNIDWNQLDEARILRQFDEFLWRAAREPAVALVALHNEPELKDPQPAEHRRVQRLLQRMVTRAEELTPHLTVVGASGGAGTAVFPPRSGYPLADDVIDRHRYLQSVWTPHQGIRAFPKLVAELAGEDERPALWSEGGTPFYAHVIYLAHLGAELIDHPAVASRIEPHLEFGQHRLSLEQFYAAISCRFHDGVPVDGLRACATRKLASTDEATLIAHAKDHFFGGRDEVARPDGGDPMVWGRQIAAELFAVQLFEARILAHRDSRFLGFIPWEQAMIGVPVPLGEPSAATHYSRELVRSAYAPQAVYARIPGGGSVEGFALNDGAELQGELVLAVGSVRERHAVVVPAGGLAQHRFELPAPPAPAVGEVRFEAAGRVLARYPVPFR